jgi:hypothetical protein
VSRTRDIIATFWEINRTVGEVERYEDSYRLCYVRGPQGIIVELAGAAHARSPSAADRSIQECEQLGEVPLGRCLVVGGGVAHRVAVSGSLVEL